MVSQEKSLGDVDVETAKEEAVPLIETDPEKGLTTDQVEKALARYGPNEIPVPEKPIYMLFLNQFTGFLPLLIEIAAIVSLGAQDYVDFGIIVGILFINGVLGFREEYHAKKSLEEVRYFSVWWWMDCWDKLFCFLTVLRRLFCCTFSGSLVSEIAIRRNGETKTMETKELVPGDICLLVGGAVVPADVKWIKGDVMSIDTAALTGEPLPRYVII